MPFVWQLCKVTLAVGAVFDEDILVQKRVLQTGDDIRDDCQREFDNHIRNMDVTGFCTRCEREGGTNPLRSTCTLCQSECPCKRVGMTNKQERLCNDGKCKNDDKDVDDEAAGLDRYHCDCEATDFEGDRCQSWIDDCNPDVLPTGLPEHYQVICGPNGNCTDKVRNYQCECHPGFKGDNCEENIDDCNPSDLPDGESLCGPNGSCVDGILSYSCTCNNGFTGKHCEFPPEAAAFGKKKDCGDDDYTSDEVSVDCKVEYSNAKTNDKIPAFCSRCHDEGGATPLRKRCSFCRQACCVD